MVDIDPNNFVNEVDFDSDELMYVGDSEIELWIRPSTIEAVQIIPPPPEIEDGFIETDEVEVTS